jgi:transcriptional regulator with XRE-family HTH domain
MGSLSSPLDFNTRKSFQTKGFQGRAQENAENDQSARSDPAEARLHTDRLAARANVSTTYVSLVEGGLEKPSPRYRKAVSKILGVPEELIFETTDGEAA